MKILIDNNCLFDYSSVSWLQRAENEEVDKENIILITDSEYTNFKNCIQILFNNCTTIGKKTKLFSPEKTLNERLDIICEIARNIIAVHVYGDSHTITTYIVPICRENWLGFNTNYPLTLYRFSREGLNLHECIKVLGNGHEKYPIREGDYAMYSYGEIDLRYLILKHLKKSEACTFSGNTTFEDNSLENMTKNLINGYITQIKLNEKIYKCKSIIFFPMPPIETPSGANLYTGSLEERIQVYDYFTTLLYQKCKENDIKIVNFYDDIIDKTTGVTKQKFLKGEGDVHLDHKYYYLIRDALMNIIQES